MSAPEDVERYLASYPADVAERLRIVRRAILAQLPDGEEKMRYGIAAIMTGGRYGLHYAGWKKHIGIYPVPVFSGELEARVQPYRSGKDTLQFPHTKDLPVDLIGDIAAEIMARRIEPPG